MSKVNREKLEIQRNTKYYYKIHFDRNRAMDDENATGQQSPSDHQISLDIERLRVDFTETQALYREVCVLLFFRYGITPTANKLYQFVRKGSMSAPTEALRAFWEDLRKKSRVRIEHPDLPESLKKTAGEMVATLWSQAQGAADQGLLELREQATESIKLAQEAQQKAEAENLGMQHVVEQLREEIRVGRERSLQLERDLASERAIQRGSIESIGRGRTADQGDRIRLD
jgi:hypothetical protein